MEISVNIDVNGKTIEPSEDLHKSLVSIIESYITQKVFSVKEKKVKKVKALKDPNRIKTPRIPMTEAQLAEVITRARQLHHLTLNKASGVIAKELKRSHSYIYSKIHKEIIKGTLTFVPSRRK